LNPKNIGYLEGRGFQAFDPAIDPVTVTIGIGGGVAISAVGTYLMSKSGTKTNSGEIKPR